MRQIISAIMLSFVKDMSSRRAKVFLFCIATGIIIIVGGMLLLFRGQPSPPPKLRETLTALSVTDENGNKWTLDLVKGQQFSGMSSNDMKPGPPLLVSTNTMKINDRQVSIGIEVKGQTGEKYLGGAVKNGKIEPEPQFIIMDEKARILKKGKFEYG
ncbi:MAG: hypothetical protein ACYSTT_06525 [Planctomycetota bacterium]